MAHLSYEEGKKLVFKGLWLLGAVTLVEVVVSLFGKGHIWAGIKDLSGVGGTIVVGIVGLLLIGLSLYKAYFIIYNFMHMAFEAKGLAMSVLLPTLLLIWAIIAFFQEGDSWKDRREQIKEKNEQSVDDNSGQQGMLLDKTYILELKG